LYRIIGIDEHFNRMDRWITVGIFVWSMFWFLLFVDARDDGSVPHDETTSAKENSDGKPAKHGYIDPF
jgi:hypothetical protein